MYDRCTGEFNYAIATYKGSSKVFLYSLYVVIMPIIIAALFSFAVVRFIGMGTVIKPCTLQVVSVWRVR